MTKNLRTVEVGVVLQLVAEERARDVDLLAADNRDLLAREDLFMVVSNVGRFAQRSEPSVPSSSTKSCHLPVVSPRRTEPAQSSLSHTASWSPPPSARPLPSHSSTGPRVPPSHPPGLVSSECEIPRALPSEFGSVDTHLLGDDRGETTKEVTLAVDDDGSGREGRHLCRRRIVGREE